MHAVADDWITRDADFNESSGRNALHGAGPITNHVAAAGLDLNPSGTPVSPDALSRCRVRSAGHDGRPLK